MYCIVPLHPCPLPACPSTPVPHRPHMPTLLQQSVRSVLGPYPAQGGPAIGGEGRRFRRSCVQGWKKAGGPDSVPLA